jgi:putative cell wall-binding protein
MKKTKDEVAVDMVTPDGNKVTTKEYKPNKSWKLKLGLGLLLLTLLVSGGVAYYFLNASKDEAVTPDAGVNTKIERIAGADRYATAALISQKQYPNGTPTAIVATGANIVDALPSVALAKKANAPILLTAKDSLPAATINELRRLKVTKIYVIGGTGAVSAKPEAALRTITTNVKRIVGANRRETSINLAREAYALNGNKTPDATAIVVDQMATVDAVTATNLAALRGWPIIYSANNDGATIGATLRSIGVSKTYVVAPAGTISDATMRNFPGYERMAGADRYATMALVAKKAESFGLKYETIGVIKADGQTLDDIAMTSYVGSKNGFTVLGVSSAQTVAIFTKAKATAKNVYIAGGTGAIDKYAEYDIKYDLGMISKSYPLDYFTAIRGSDNSCWGVNNVRIYQDKIKFDIILRQKSDKGNKCTATNAKVRPYVPGENVSASMLSDMIMFDYYEVVLATTGANRNQMKSIRISGLSLRENLFDGDSEGSCIGRCTAYAEWYIARGTTLPVTMEITRLLPAKEYELHIDGNSWDFTTLK